MRPSAWGWDEEQAVIGFLLGAGLGTRLRPLSLEFPKPAWPFFDVPLAANVLGMLLAAGVREVVVNLHHLPERLQAALVPWIPAEVRVHWSPEDPIQGTGGALLPWRDLLDRGPFFLANGDTFQELDLKALARQHGETSAFATLALRPLPEGVRGPVEVDGEGRIVRFLDAKAPGYRAGRACEFTGIHLLEPVVLDHLPPRPHCINADVHRNLVARGERLFGFVPVREAFWSDLGTPERYLGAHFKLLEEGCLPTAAPGRLVLDDEDQPLGGRVLAPSYLGSEVRVPVGAVAGPFAVLGSRSSLAPGARVTRSVVWAGAEAVGELRGAILSPSGERMACPEAGRSAGAPSPR